MKKIMDRLIILTLLGVAIVVGLSHWGLPAVLEPEPPKPDTVRIRVLQQSQATAETTRVTVTRLRTLVDTLPGDTVYVPREVVRTVIRDCLACATQLDSLRAYADSALRAKDDSIVALRQRNFQLERQLVACKGQRPWYLVGGASAGLLACIAKN